MKKIVLIFGIALMSVTLNAQSDADVWELAKTDLKTEYKTIIISHMNFSDSEAEAFWPVFNEYMAKKSASMDKQIAAIKKFADNYDSLTDEVLEDLDKDGNSRIIERQKARIAYYKKLKKILSTRKAAKLYQIDGQITTLLDFQVVSQIPIIE